MPLLDRKCTVCDWRDEDYLCGSTEVREWNCGGCSEVGSVIVDIGSSYRPHHRGLPSGGASFLDGTKRQGFSEMKEIKKIEAEAASSKSSADNKKAVAKEIARLSKSK